jgi:putative tricarboxylic transport membrane protein
LLTLAFLALVVPIVLRLRGRGKLLSQLAADDD